MAVSLLGHIAFAILLAYTMYRITKCYWTSLMALYFFVCGASLPPFDFDVDYKRAYPVNTPISPGDTCIVRWIDQPDIVCAFATFLAMTMLVQRRWSAFMVAFVVAVCFKESGWFILPIALLVCWRFRLWRDVPMGHYAIFAAAIVVLAALKLHTGLHLHEGPNFRHIAGGWRKYLITVAGAGLQSASFSPLCLFGLAAGAVLGLWKAISIRIHAGAIMVVVALCVAMASLANNVDPLVGSLMVFDFSWYGLKLIVPEAFLGLALVLFFRYAKDHRPTIIFGGAFAISALVLVVNPNQTDHITYGPLAFLACLEAYGVVSILRTVVGLTRSHPNYPPPSVQQPDEARARGNRLAGL
jgi:hypothetical protein